MIFGFSNPAIEHGDQAKRGVRVVLGVGMAPYRLGENGLYGRFLAVPGHVECPPAQRGSRLGPVKLVADARLMLSETMAQYDLSPAALRDIQAIVAKLTSVAAG